MSGYNYKKDLLAEIGRAARSYGVFAVVAVALLFAVSCGKEEPWVEPIEKAYKLYSKQRYEESIRSGEYGLKLEEAALGEYPELAGTYYILALSNKALGNYAEAESLNKRALKLLEKGSGKDSLRLWTIKTIHNLAVLYVEQGRFDEAIPLQKKALEMFENLKNQDELLLMAYRRDLLSSYYGAGYLAEAEAYGEHLLTIAEEGFNDAPFPTAKLVVTLNDLSFIYGETGRYVEAETHFKRSLDITKKKLSSEPEILTEIFLGLFEVYDASGDRAKADLALKRVLEIMPKSPLSEHSGIQFYRKNRFRAYYDAGNLDRASLIARRALKVAEKSYEKDKGAAASLVKALNNSPLLYTVRKKREYKKAESILKRSLSIAEGDLGPDHLAVAETLTLLSRIYHAQNRGSDTELLIKRSLEIRGKL